MTRQMQIEIAILAALISTIVLICTASQLSGDVKWLSSGLMVGVYLTQAMFRQQNPHNDHHVTF
ncbi:MAG: hypothetical protein AAF787_19050 [Chloroflexota bacterium]